MLYLVLGGLALFIFWGGLRAFERAPVSSIKSLVAWIAALGGILLVFLLIVSGRWPLALGALTLFGPTLWKHWRGAQPGATNTRAGGSSTNAAPRRPGAMTREEAYQVLGLKPGANEAEIRAAHHRLMRGAHPDAGGSDWLASRINQARDMLLDG